MHSNSLPHIRCFRFELFINKTPVSFKSRKAKKNFLHFSFIMKETGFRLIKSHSVCWKTARNIPPKIDNRTILYRLKQALALIIWNRSWSLPTVKCVYILNSSPVIIMIISRDRRNCFRAIMGEYPWAETTRAAMWTKMVK